MKYECNHCNAIIVTGGGLPAKCHKCGGTNISRRETKDLHASAIHFHECDTALMEAATGVLLRKGKEYSPGGDRFGNFRLAARLQGITPEKALIGMMDKHVVSIHDAIRDGKARPLDWWEEKIMDNINYLRMLWGMLNLPLSSHAEQVNPSVRD